MSLNPRSFIGWIADKSRKMEIMDQEDVDIVFGPVFEKIGLEHPDKVTVAITDGIGPTCTGMDGPRGGVIFFPYELFALMNPATAVTFEGSYSGPVGELPDETRRELLKSGFLVPTPEQIQFIFGHEVAHLKHQHTRETSKIALLTAFFTHSALKVNNLFAFRSDKYRFMEIRSTPVYVGLIMAVTAMVVFALSWDQELQADATSARQLGLEDPALGLKESQVQQHDAFRRMGVHEIDLEHPPPVLQMINLRWLRESIRKREGR